MQFCLELSEQKRVPLCLSFMVDILIERIEKKIQVEVSFDFRGFSRIDVENSNFSGYVKFVIQIVL